MTIGRREFLQKAGLGALQLGLMGYLSNYSYADLLKTGQLPRSLPELQGVKSSGILNFVKAVEEGNLNLHSIMVLRHGKVLAEGWWAPYASNLKHTLYSLSKSFTSSAIGFAVAEGRLTVNDKVVSFFPDQLPEKVSKNLGAMRVQDLLTMRTGHAKDSTSALREANDPNWVKSFLAFPVEHEPGTFFVYNSGATYMLSAIIEKLTGQKLIDYLTPRLFKPLGIEGMDWETDPNGINTGGWGLRVKTEDIAKFGQMYLQNGVWNGKQILPKKWITEATSAQVPSKGTESDWEQGYGYQFWRCRHDAFRGDGAYGQYCIVMPKQDMVIAITSETSDMGAILNQIWKHILPAVGEGAIRSTTDQAALKQKMASLALTIPKVSNTAEISARVNHKKYIITNNDLKINTVSFDFDNDGCNFSMTDDKGTHPVSCGLGQWKSGLTDISTLPLKLAPTDVPGETKTKIVASGTWTNPNTFEMIWRFIETAHYQLVTCSFDGDNISVAFRRSLAVLGNTQDPRPILTGKMAG